jgi:hypothetical protein
MCVFYYFIKKTSTTYSQALAKYNPDIMVIEMVTPSAIQYTNIISTVDNIMQASLPTQLYQWL